MIFRDNFQVHVYAKNTKIFTLELLLITNTIFKIFSLQSTITITILTIFYKFSY